MIGSPAIANLIRESKTFQLPSILQTSGKLGMITLEQTLKKLVAGGEIDEKVAADVLQDLDITLEKS